MRLRRWEATGPAILRRVHGRGFRYLTADGTPADADTVARIKQLAVPPAWRDVHICPWPNGHLQAVGTDDAGRRQYLYHDQWRRRRDREKFRHVRVVARRLPAARQRIEDDLATPGLNRQRVLAAAARLLDLGLFRIGNEEYAESNGSYGLSTVRRDHVRFEAGGTLVFEYPAKSGRDLVQVVADDRIVEVVRALLRRRDDGDTLLAYYERPLWRAVRSVDINAYLDEVVGEGTTAKDFRTWHATVLAAVALAVAHDTVTSPSARRRAEARAMREVAEYLGNTPAVCRAAYVDPIVVDAFRQGVTVAAALPLLGAAGPDEPATWGAVERAVLRLLDEA